MNTLVPVRARARARACVCVCIGRITRLPYLQHKVVHVLSDIVGEVDRSHGVPGAKAHCDVDVLRGGIAALHQKLRLERRQSQRSTV